MALKIEFEGYVNEVKNFSWGAVVKMSHSQRAKNKDTGLWETIGKDYIDVVLPEGFNAAQINEGMILNVFGTFKVETYPKNDGSTGVAIKVRATDVSNVERQSGYAAKPDAGAALRSVGATPVAPEDMPF